MIYDLQKANGFKRISAFLFDIIIFFIIAVGLACVFAIIFGVDAKQAELETYHNEYTDRYKEEYGIDLDAKSAEEIAALPEEERAIYEQANTEWQNDERVLKVNAAVYSLFILVISLSLLFTFLIVEFAVPLFLKNGQTLGKKIFGVGVMRLDCVRMTAPLLFVRGILGKFTIETMVPLLILLLIIIGQAGIVGLIALVLILVLQIVVIIATKTHSAVHDILSSTVVIDLASQMIFDTAEDMLEYKKKIHAESAEKSPY